MPRAAFHADVGAAEDAGAAVDDVRGSVVDARDEHLRRRKVDDYGSIFFAIHIFGLQEREVDAGDHVAGGVERQLVAGERVREQVVCLADRADADHAHGRGFEAIQIANARDQRSEVDGLFLAGDGANGRLYWFAREKGKP